jgi:hypothetical protein
MAVTSVNASVSAVTIFSANARAQARRMVNDSTSVCYVCEGGTASATNYTYRLDPYDRLEMPLPLFQSEVTAIWVTATGAMRVTEW